MENGRFYIPFSKFRQNRYSVNELELLLVVWDKELFKYYLHSQKFTVITDNRSLFSLMKEYRSNKSSNSRLLLFNFEIEHLPGARMGLIDYILCGPYLFAPKIAQYDEQFIVAKLDIMKRAQSNFERNEPQLQASCQSFSPNELFTIQIVPQKEDSIHAAENNSAKTNSKNFSLKAGFSSKNFEQNDSSNLIATPSLKIDLIVLSE